MTTGPGITTEDYLAHVRAAVAHLAHAVEHGPLDARVAACPDWDVRALVAHVGSVHRWAEAAARTAERPALHDAGPPEDADARALVAWLRHGATRLVATLRTIDAGAPTWHPFPVPRVVAVWPRRQAHETAIHAWDAEHAVGLTPATINRVLAADGVAEYFELVLPRLVEREAVALPSGSLEVRATDTGHAWHIVAEGSAVLVAAVAGVGGDEVGGDEVGGDDRDADGEATLAGPAAAILGRLWNRPIDDEAVTMSGDPAVADAWLALPGM